MRRRLRLLGKTEQPATLADFLDGDHSQVPQVHQDFISTHYQAILAYRPRRYAGEVTLFRARAQALSRLADPDKGWRPLAGGGLDIREFEGSHHTLLSEPFVGHLAAALQRKLDELPNA